MEKSANKGKVFLVSLGCPKNLVDSEIMLGILARKGYSIAKRENDADIIIVNTCAFIREAKEESISTIIELGRMKEVGSCKLLIVTGCLSQRYHEELLLELPEVDHFLDIGEINRIAEVIEGPDGIESPKHGEPINDLNLFRIHTGYPFIGWVKIAEGCSNRCSYCVIPSIRGPLKSRSIKSIIEEVKGLVERGVVELNLVAQDVAGFGLDRGKRGELPELIRALCRIDGLRWIRLLYCHPLHMTEEIIKTIADEGAMCRYIDMPIQHIEDDILERMNRGVRGRDIRSLIYKIRETIPGVNLRTTVIVGFPGETEDKFRSLLKFIEEVEFDRLGCFKYSREEGTPAFNMDGHVPERIKRRRLKEVLQLQSSISRKKNYEFLGTIQDVLIECRSRMPDLRKMGFGNSYKGSHVIKGRTQYQAPEIDGNVFITEGIARPGQIVPVLIKDAGNYDLIGEIVKN